MKKGKKHEKTKDAKTQRSQRPFLEVKICIYIYIHISIYIYIYRYLLKPYETTPPKLQKTDPRLKASNKGTDMYRPFCPITGSMGPVDSFTKLGSFIL